jgi:hypothetical protein
MGAAKLIGDDRKAMLTMKTTNLRRSSPTVDSQQIRGVYMTALRKGNAVPQLRGYAGGLFFRGLAAAWSGSVAVAASLEDSGAPREVPRQRPSATMHRDLLTMM